MALNMEQINQLKEIESASGQSGLLANIVNMFLDTIEQEKAQLVAMLEHQKFGDASKLAHSMKSSSRNVGADELAKVLQYIEDIGSGRGDPSTYNHESTVQQVRELLSQAIEELKKLIE